MRPAAIRTLFWIETVAGEVSWQESSQGPKEKSCNETEGWATSHTQEWGSWPVGSLRTQGIPPRQPGTLRCSQNSWRDLATSCSLLGNRNLQLTCGLLQSIAPLGKKPVPRNRTAPESGVAPDQEAASVKWIPALGAGVTGFDLRRACLSGSVARTQGFYLSQTSLSAVSRKSASRGWLQASSLPLWFMPA